MFSKWKTRSLPDYASSSSPLKTPYNKMPRSLSHGKSFERVVNGNVLHSWHHEQNSRVQWLYKQKKLFMRNHPPIGWFATHSVLVLRFSAYVWDSVLKVGWQSPPEIPPPWATFKKAVTEKPREREREREREYTYINKHHTHTHTNSCSGWVKIVSDEISTRGKRELKVRESKKGRVRERPSQ